MTCHTLLAVKLPPAQHTFFIFCQRTDSLQSCCVTGLTNTELLFFVNVAILFSPVVSRFGVSLGLLFSANVRLLFSPVVSLVNSCHDLKVGNVPLRRSNFFKVDTLTLLLINIFTPYSKTLSPKDIK